MAVWLAAAGLGMSAIQTGLGIKGGKAAEEAARAAARREAKIEHSVTSERVRQIRRQQEMLRAETIARVAGSGIKVSSKSPLEVLADQESEFKREVDITKEVGASRATAALSRGQMVGEQYKYQGYQQALSGISSMFNIAANTDWSA